MKSTLILFTVLTGLTLAACGNNGGGSSSMAQSKDFTSFVTTLVNAPPSSDSTPVWTNNVSFMNLGTDNPNAFAGVNFGSVETPPGTSLATKACANAGPTACQPGIH